MAAGCPLCAALGSGAYAAVLALEWMLGQGWPLWVAHDTTRKVPTLVPAAYVPESGETR